MRFILERNLETVELSRDFHRFLVRPDAKVVYSFFDDGSLNSKYEYVSQRLDVKDNKTQDERTYCLVILVGDKLQTSSKERENLRTEVLN